MARECEFEMKEIVQECFLGYSQCRMPNVNARTIRPNDCYAGVIAACFNAKNVKRTLVVITGVQTPTKECRSEVSKGVTKDRMRGIA